MAKRVLPLLLTAYWSLVIGHWSFAADDLAAVRKIDQMIAAEWQKHNLKPAPPADDAEFFRRLYLDLCGVIPPADELIAFLNDKSPDKRQKAIDRLLESPKYAEHFATVWTNILVGRKTVAKFAQLGAGAMKEWLKERFAKNVPYDQWVRELLTAEGWTDENGAVIFFARNEFKPENLAGQVSRVFLGVQIQCAQCHDDRRTHTWKQEDFWGFAAFFARVRPVERMRGMGRPRLRIADVPMGQVRTEMMGEGKVVFPKLLDGKTIPPGPFVNRRQELAKWLTSADNPWFAQAIVNRMWGYFLGRGFVEPVDDFNDDNPPSHPELLKALADDFVKHSFDLKHLMRVILNSKVYQLSSRGSKEMADDEERYFSRAQLRPLSPEQLFESLFQATGIEEAIRARRPEMVERLKEMVLRRFVFLFDTDEMQEEGEFVQTIPQALFLMNSEIVSRGLGVPGGTLAKIVNSDASDAEKIEQLFLHVLSRLPTPQEKADLLAYLNKRANGRAAPVPEQSAEQPKAKPGKLAEMLRKGKFKKGERAQQKLLRRLPPGGARDPKRQAYEDVLWAMLNSSEFLFNH